ncbi:Hypothetical predicted protein, partial [Pelobates cultripes]
VVFYPRAFRSWCPGLPGSGHLSGTVCSGAAYSATGAAHACAVVVAILTVAKSFAMLFPARAAHLG